MPANLTPQYKESEQLFRQARTREEKLSALEEMLRGIPKHKGTEKLQANLKKRLAKLRKSAVNSSNRSFHPPFYQIDREGAGSVVVCGPPNSGKSELVDQLTGACPEVAEYAFTTRLPLAGIMKFEDVQIQLVDTPPLTPETMETWMLKLIHQSDIVLLVFDINDPAVLEQTDFILKLFSAKEISPEGKPNLLVLAGKMDVVGANENLEIWKDSLPEYICPQPFTTRNADAIENLRTKLFKRLELVRVYTKRPSHPIDPDSVPFLLKKGATVIEAARCVHQDFVNNFRFARIWRSPDRKGLMIDQNEEVRDGDILEIHAG